jgi:hypothetical protein
MLLVRMRMILVLVYHQAALDCGAMASDHTLGGSATARTSPIRVNPCASVENSSQRQLAPLIRVNSSNPWKNPFACGLALF